MELYKAVYPNVLYFTNNFRSQFREEPKQVAKDILHDALVVLLNHIETGKYQPEKASLSSYCTGIAKGLLQNQMRKKDFQRKADVQESVEAELLVAGELQDKNLEMLELKNALKNCINFLTDKYKSIIELRFFEELSWKEIAEKMQYSSEHTALMTAKRGLDSLKNCLSNKGFGLAWE